MKFLLLVASWAMLQLSPAASSVLPFVVLHGISDECKHHGITKFTTDLGTMSGAPGYCIEIGNGASDSWFLRLDKQVELACKEIKLIPELAGGYNIVGLSQGNLIGRGLIEWCDGPPVNNMVSLGGPHAGIASLPLCAAYSFCALADIILHMGVYSDFVQNHLAPTGYIKMPKDLSSYYRSCVFLPKLNNELPQNRNATFKHRLSDLNQLVLVKFDKDTVLVPQETAWFGFFPPNDLTKVLPMEETALYKEDWIGLKSLHEQGRIQFVTFSGDHLSISDQEMLDHVAPYLKPEKTRQREEHASIM
ncbi:hypothetical protein SELMODRAFT_74606 [Selaginella moellendorffii]|nr:hypothetical protein SELMODRAFT_74606 [Selaginella moellendorffii]